MKRKLAKYFAFVTRRCSLVLILSNVILINHLFHKHLLEHFSMRRRTSNIFHIPFTYCISKHSLNAYFTAFFIIQSSQQRKMIVLVLWAELLCLVNFQKTLGHQSNMLSCFFDQLGCSSLKPDSSNFFTKIFLVFKVTW